MKIVVIGNVATGKTSLCVRWAHGTFTDHYKATVGVDFVVKGDCQLWDVAGQERFGAVTASFYRASHGALDVCASRRKCRKVDTGLSAEIHRRHAHFNNGQQG